MEDISLLQKLSYVAAGPGMVQWLMYSVTALLVSSGALFLVGHRLRHAHWLTSLATMFAVSAAAWSIQHGMSGQVPPFDVSMAVALLAGALVTAAFKDWNPVGHASFASVILASVSYLGYAIYVLVYAHLGILSILFGLVLLGLQFAALLLLAVHTFEIIDVMCRTHWRFAADAKRVEGYAPKVSIHVPIHREPPEMVIETLNALAALDYPDYEVLVIDNNTPEETLWRPVEAHCARLGPKFRFFHLLPWPGYKSGALNFALGETSKDAEIIGIVDSDYVVERDWLANLVGHFSDPKMAFVQTPQDYRDIDSRGRFGKALALSYIYFFRISMASRNERNAIIFAGTMGLLRKSALAEVGGWDEWCITEDAEVSLRLLNAGYRSLYVDRTYGRGLMPLDYAGLKKQRFRWAFGGMQLLRMHASKLLNPWSGGRLNLAQRWSYLSGGLQWLNDPMSLAFTAILLLGGVALLLTGSFESQPLVGAVLFVPPLFILFAVGRFLWALRQREASCRTFAESVSALVILLGLTWVVTLACVRGIVSHEGVFLRTPKQAEVPSLRDTLRVSLWESALAAACLVLAVALLKDAAPAGLARILVVGLLLWQAFIYASTLTSALWDYQQRQAVPFPRGLGFRAIGSTIGRSLTEPRTAVWVVGAFLLFSASWYVAQASAPLGERLYLADPLGQFVRAPSVMTARAPEKAGSVLVREADAAKHADLDSTLALWAADGVIIDENHTPDDASDDVVWRGTEGIRERYLQEFSNRRYRDLRHKAMHIDFAAGTAVITNDLQATVEETGNGSVERVALPQSDRWVLRLVDGQWKIVSLQLNRARRARIYLGEAL